MGRFALLGVIVMKRLCVLLAALGCASMVSAVPPNPTSCNPIYPSTQTPCGADQDVDDCINEVMNDCWTKLNQEYNACTFWWQITPCQSSAWCNLVDAINEASFLYEYCVLVQGASCEDCAAQFCNAMYLARANYFIAISGCCKFAKTPPPGTPTMEVIEIDPAAYVDPMVAVSEWNRIMSWNRDVTTYKAQLFTDAG